MLRTALGLVLSLVGAVIGAIVGLWAFKWFYYYHLYAMVLPGACLGLGSYLVSPMRSGIRGMILGFAALGVGIWAEWNYFPFVKDETFSYFIRNLGDVNPIHLLMIGVGGVFGFWWGREKSPWISAKPKPSRNVEV